MAEHLFVVGAQRSGTTYLYEMLDAHPEIYMAKPVKPEPKYFMGLTTDRMSRDDYVSRYFSEAGDAKWFGEKSTSYLESEKAARAIKQNFPAAKILVMLRDPIERAISHFSFTKDHGLEPFDIERAFQEEPARKDSWRSAGTSVSPYAYLERGKYWQYLEQWESLFGKENLVLLVKETFTGNLANIQALYRRLGVDDEFAPPGLDERVNAGSKGRGKCVLPAQTRAALREMYRPWNRVLTERYGLDLTCWESDL